MIKDKTFYGLTYATDLFDLANEVCESLGRGSNGKAVDLLVETVGAETIHGTLKDPTVYAGLGLTQFDKMPFQDVKDRCRESDKQNLKESFNIDIDLVEWEHLRYNPFLALIFTRLKYKKVPEAIPKTLEDRARYRKKYYNTEAGKGTSEHYIKANRVA